jgi:hypothetical protein
MNLKSNERERERIIFLSAALNCALFALFDYMYEAENASCNINKNHLQLYFSGQ